jgi:hypothetical protein
MAQLLVDLANGFVKGVSHQPVSLNANTNGVGIDFVNAANVRTHLIVQTGVITASGLFNYKVQESDDNSTFVAAADTTNSNTGNLNTANSISILSFNRAKRYARVVATLVSGTSVIASSMLLAQQSPDGSNTAGYSVAPQS